MARKRKKRQTGQKQKTLTNSAFKETDKEPEEKCRTPRGRNRDCLRADLPENATSSRQKTRGFQESHLSSDLNFRDGNKRKEIRKRATLLTPKGTSIVRLDHSDMPARNLRSRLQNSCLSTALNAGEEERERGSPRGNILIPGACHTHHSVSSSRQQNTGGQEPCLAMELNAGEEENKTQKDQTSGTMLHDDVRHDVCHSDMPARNLRSRLQESCLFTALNAGEEERERGSPRENLLIPGACHTHHSVLSSRQQNTGGQEPCLAMELNAGEENKTQKDQTSGTMLHDDVRHDVCHSDMPARNLRSRLQESCLFTALNAGEEERERGSPRENLLIPGACHTHHSVLSSRQQNTGGQEPCLAMELNAGEENKTQKDQTSGTMLHDDVRHDVCHSDMPARNLRSRLQESCLFTALNAGEEERERGSPRENLLIPGACHTHHSVSSSRQQNTGGQEPCLAMELNAGEEENKTQKDQTSETLLHNDVRHDVRHSDMPARNLRSRLQNSCLSTALNAGEEERERGSPRGNILIPGACHTHHSVSSSRQQNTGGQEPCLAMELNAGEEENKTQKDQTSGTLLHDDVRHDVCHSDMPARNLRSRLQESCLFTALNAGEEERERGSPRENILIPGACHTHHSVSSRQQNTGGQEPCLAMELNAGEEENKTQKDQTSGTLLHDDVRHDVCHSDMPARNLRSRLQESCLFTALNAGEEERERGSPRENLLIPEACHTHHSVSSSRQQNTGGQEPCLAMELTAGEEENKTQKDQTSGTMLHDDVRHDVCLSDTSPRQHRNDLTMTKCLESGDKNKIKEDLTRRHPQLSEVCPDENEANVSLKKQICPDENEANISLKKQTCSFTNDLDYVNGSGDTRHDPATPSSSKGDNLAKRKRKRRLRRKCIKTVLEEAKKDESAINCVERAINTVFPGMRERSEISDPICPLIRSKSSEDILSLVARARHSKTLTSRKRKRRKKNSFVSDNEAQLPKLFLPSASRKKTCLNELSHDVEEPKRGISETSSSCGITSINDVPRVTRNDEGCTFRNIEGETILESCYMTKEKLSIGFSETSSCRGSLSNMIAPRSNTFKTIDENQLLPASENVLESSCLTDQDLSKGFSLGCGKPLYQNDMIPNEEAVISSFKELSKQPQNQSISCPTSDGINGVNSSPVSSVTTDNTSEVTDKNGNSKKQTHQHDTDECRFSKRKHTQAFETNGHTCHRSKHTHASDTNEDVYTWRKHTRESNEDACSQKKVVRAYVVATSSSSTVDAVTEEKSTVTAERLKKMKNTVLVKYPKHLPVTAINTPAEQTPIASSNMTQVQKSVVGNNDSVQQLLVNRNPFVRKLVAGYNASIQKSIFVRVNLAIQKSATVGNAPPVQTQAVASGNLAVQTSATVGNASNVQTHAVARGNLSVQKSATVGNAPPVQTQAVARGNLSVQKSATVGNAPPVHTQVVASGNLAVQKSSGTINKNTLEFCPIYEARHQKCFQTKDEENRKTDAEPADLCEGLIDRSVTILLGELSNSRSKREDECRKQDDNRHTDISADDVQTTRTVTQLENNERHESICIEDDLLNEGSNNPLESKNVVDDNASGEATYFIKDVLQSNESPSNPTNLLESKEVVDAEDLGYSCNSIKNVLHGNMGYSNTCNSLVQKEPADPDDARNFASHSRTRDMNVRNSNQYNTTKLGSKSKIAMIKKQQRTSSEKTCKQAADCSESSRTHRQVCSSQNRGSQKGEKHDCLRSKASVYRPSKSVAVMHLSSNESHCRTTNSDKPQRLNESWSHATNSEITSSNESLVLNTNSDKPLISNVSRNRAANADTFCSNKPQDRATNLGKPCLQESLSYGITLETTGSNDSLNHGNNSDKHLSLNESRRRATNTDEIGLNESQCGTTNSYKTIEILAKNEDVFLSSDTMSGTDSSHDASVNNNTENCTDLKTEVGRAFLPAGGQMEEDGLTSSGLQFELPAQNDGRCERMKSHIRGEHKMQDCFIDLGSRVSIMEPSSCTKSEANVKDKRKRLSPECQIRETVVNDEKKRLPCEFEIREALKSEISEEGRKLLSTDDDATVVLIFPNMTSTISDVISSADNANYVTGRTFLHHSNPRQNQGNSVSQYESDVISKRPEMHSVTSRTVCEKRPSDVTKPCMHSENFIQEQPKINIPCQKNEFADTFNPANSQKYDVMEIMNSEFTHNSEIAESVKSAHIKKCQVSKSVKGMNTQICDVPERAKPTTPQKNEVPEKEKSRQTQKKTVKIRYPTGEEKFVLINKSKVTSGVWTTCSDDVNTNELLTSKSCSRTRDEHVGTVSLRPGDVTRSYVQDLNSPYRLASSGDVFQRPLQRISLRDDDVIIAPHVHMPVLVYPIESGHSGDVLEPSLKKFKTSSPSRENAGCSQSLPPLAEQSAEKSRSKQRKPSKSSQIPIKSPGSNVSIYMRQGAHDGRGSHKTVVYVPIQNLERLFQSFNPDTKQQVQLRIPFVRQDPPRSRHRVNDDHIVESLFPNPKKAFYVAGTQIVRHDGVARCRSRVMEVYHTEEAYTTASAIPPFLYALLVYDDDPSLAVLIVNHICPGLYRVEPTSGLGQIKRQKSYVHELVVLKQYPITVELPECDDYFALAVGPLERLRKRAIARLNTINSSMSVLNVVKQIIGKKECRCFHSMRQHESGHRVEKTKLLSGAELDGHRKRLALFNCNCPECIPFKKRNKNKPPDKQKAEETGSSSSWILGKGEEEIPTNKEKNSDSSEMSWMLGKDEEEIRRKEENAIDLTSSGIIQDVASEEGQGQISLIDNQISSIRESGRKECYFSPENADETEICIDIAGDNGLHKASCHSPGVETPCSLNSTSPCLDVTGESCAKETTQYLNVTKEPCSMDATSIGIDVTEEPREKETTRCLNVTNELCSREVTEEPCARDTSRGLDVTKESGSNEATCLGILSGQSCSRETTSPNVDINVKKESGSKATCLGILSGQSCSRETTSPNVDINVKKESGSKATCLGILSGQSCSRETSPNVDIMSTSQMMYRSFDVMGKYDSREITGESDVQETSRPYRNVKEQSSSREISGSRQITGLCSYVPNDTCSSQNTCPGSQSNSGDTTRQSVDPNSHVGRNKNRLFIRFNFRSLRKN